jgi:hypothetical protein
MLSNKNIKILLNYIAGPVLFVWLSLSLYRQLNRQPDLPLAWRHIRQAFSGNEAWKIYAVIILVLVNWGIEARKWQLLIRPLEKISWWKAFKATISGVAFSVLTPNRIGEYAGRMLYLEEGHRLRSIPLTLIGSLAQLIITLFAGIAGMMLMNNFWQQPMLAHTVPVLFMKASLYVIGTIAMVLLLFFLRVSVLSKWIEKIPATGKFSQYIEAADHFSNYHLFKILWLSLFRYLVFTLQYVWLLQVLQVEVSLIQGLVLVSVLFLLLSVYPTFALLELVIRQQLGILIIGLVSANTLGITAASTGIWLLNLVLPAIIGSLFILSVRMYRNRNV